MSEVTFEQWHDRIRETARMPVNSAHWLGLALEIMEAWRAERDEMTDLLDRFLGARADYKTRECIFCRADLGETHKPDCPIMRALKLRSAQKGGPHE